ncbi:ABC transporter permease [Microlunatus flavus]|uniref:Putative ABC transport system permease protein n=1 Tax=Microlunatus flavus TaxID=1036181 RepID=A0A1H9MDE9_9ACTN|nr:ABC transporter permease [Microlunatus flavus]SER21694.1 putative ABC transport system permease protein [Microlunatus flavus]
MSVPALRTPRVRPGETLAIALESVRTHRMRSLLTVLGIWIGIASVTLTVGLGQGAQQKVADQINSLGSNLLVVSPGSSTTGGVRAGRGTATTLTLADAQALADPTVAPDVAHVAPVRTTSGVLTSGSTTWTTSVTATTPEWLGVRARSLAEGRFLTAQDETTAAHVLVLGGTTVSELGLRTGVGSTVTLGGTAFTVVGVLADSGSSGSTDEDDLAVTPLSTAEAVLGTAGSNGSVSSIYLQGASGDRLSAAYQEAYAALATRHDTGATTTAGATTGTARAAAAAASTSSVDFSITSQQSLVQAATSTSKTLTVLLAGIAGISLLVGGIGVMNIMLVSVSERIREIGLRKALGAPPALIRRQFLAEACLLALAGGVLGLGTGYLGALLLPSLIDQPVTISLPASLGALGVALAVGVVAGVYPASRAARLAPIDALRSD